VCPTGAKASVDLTHVAAAEATGHARVLAEATVLRLATDGAGRITEAVYAGRDGIERRVSARMFVVAAGAVETARLLLLSAPTGLANRSGLVGRYFMSHPAIDVLGRAPRRVDPYRIGFSTAMATQFAVGPERGVRGGFLLEFLNSAGPTPEQIATTSGLWGEALARRVREEFGYSLGIRAYAEPWPERTNAVQLNARLRDSHGSAAPHVHLMVGRYERRALDHARDVATRILAAAGCTDIRPTARTYSAHQLGTHRMGLDPTTSVVDPTLRSHDVRNLYLVGGGCFVTATPMPPTLTIVALAIRAARQIAGELRPAAQRESIGPASRRTSIA
jgi:choline dehydrogenase-like flavoprotein